MRINGGDEKMKARFSFTLLEVAFVVMAALWAAAPAYAGNGVGNNCTFQAKGLSTANIILDPSSTVSAMLPISASTLNADKVGDCAQGQNMTVAVYGGNTQYLTNTSNPLGGSIKYTIVGIVQNLSGQSSGVYVSFLASTGAYAVIAPSDFAGASAGTYSGTVSIDVSP